MSVCVFVHQQLLWHAALGFYVQIPAIEKVRRELLDRLGVWAQLLGGSMLHACTFFFFFFFLFFFSLTNFNPVWPEMGIGWGCWCCLCLCKCGFLSVLVGVADREYIYTFCTCMCTCVCVCACLLGKPFQPCHWLDLGIWDCSSFTGCWLQQLITDQTCILRKQVCSKLYHFSTNHNSTRSVFLDVEMRSLNHGYYRVSFEALKLQRSLYSSLWQF